MKNKINFGQILYIFFVLCFFFFVFFLFNNKELLSQKKVNHHRQQCSNMSNNLKEIQNTLDEKQKKFNENCK